MSAGAVTSCYAEAAIQVNTKYPLTAPSRTTTKQGKYCPTHLHLPTKLGGSTKIGKMLDNDQTILVLELFPLNTRGIFV